MPATLGARTVADVAAATVLEAEFRRMKEELERSRRESRRVEEKSRDTRLRLEQDRVAASYQAVIMAQVVARFAPEATQHVEELKRSSATQVAQAQHLKDHVRLAERHIEEIGAENQQ